MENFDGELLDHIDFTELEALISSSDGDAAMCRLGGGSGSLDEDSFLSLLPEPWNDGFDDHAICDSTGTGTFDLEENDLHVTSLPPLRQEMDAAKPLDEAIEDLALFQPTSHLNAVPGRSTGVGFVEPGTARLEKLHTGSIHVNQSTDGKVDISKESKGKSKKRRQRPVSVEEKKERRKESNRRAAEKYRKKQKETTETTQKDYFRVVRENKFQKSVIKALQKELETILQILKQHSAICQLGFHPIHHSP